MRIEVFQGAGIESVLEDVARLRIEVFREFPYLYDGDLAYERAYLAHYRDGEGAVVVAAIDGDRVVGAATGAPLSQHADDFAAAFAETDHRLEEIFYCAESVLLPAYRGRGLGHAFFDAREAQARALEKSFSAFCAVIRPLDHPARPAGYRPLDPFWRKRGYAPLDRVIARFSWKDLGEPDETAKPLQFWLRAL